MRKSTAVRRPKDRKAQIALAAAELFCVKGYPAVGIDEIAHVVGISGPAIYRHFPTKYAMLAQASRELAGEVLAATAALSTLDELLDTLADLAVRRRRVGGVYQFEGRHLEREDREWVHTALTTMLGRLTAPIAQLRPDLSTADTQLVARSVMSVMASLATHRAPISPVRAQETLVGAAWSLIRADPAPSPPTGGPLVGEPASATSPHRRELLMAAALRLFHERGYHAVSMEEIGRAAGITASSVYRHFPGKADLLAALLHRATERVGAMTEEAVSTAVDPREALCRLVDSYVDLVFGQTNLVSVYREAHGHLPERDRHELRKGQRLHVEEWVRLLVTVRPELGAPAARVLAHAALGLIYDLARLARFANADAYDRRVATLARTVVLG